MRKAPAISLEEKITYTLTSKSTNTALMFSCLVLRWTDLFFCFLCLSFGLPTVTASFLVVFFPLLHYPFRLCFRSFYTFNLFLMCVCGGVWCARVQVCLLWVFVWCPLLIRRATPCWPDNDLFRWKKWGFIRKWLWLHKANSCVSFPWKRLCKSNALVR